MEDLVTFEIAKKLKEKGFPIKTLQHKYSDKVENEIERREYFDSMYGFNPEED